MELDWYCTDMLEMRHLCWWGLLWIFKRLLVSPLGRQRSPHQNVWFFIVNIQANRVAIVSSGITNILTIASIGPSQFNLFWMTLFSSVLVLFIASFYCTTFVQFSAFCVWFSAFCLTLCFCSIRFFCSVFGWFSVFSVRYWKCIPGISIPLYNIQQAVNKHHTADSAIFCLSIGSNRPIRHRGISGTNFSIRVKQTTRQYQLWWFFPVTFEMQKMKH